MRCQLFGAAIDVFRVRHPPRRHEFDKSQVQGQLVEVVELLVIVARREVKNFFDLVGDNPPLLWNGVKQLFD